MDHIRIVNDRLDDARHLDDSYWYDPFPISPTPPPASHRRIRMAAAVIVGAAAVVAIAVTLATAVLTLFHAADAWIQPWL